MLNFFRLMVMLLPFVIFTAVQAEEEMAVDLADSFDFEAFHKEDSITIYSSESENLFDSARGQGIDTYNSESTQQQAEEPVVKTPEQTSGKRESEARVTDGQQVSTFEAGQKLNIRTAYRLGDSDDLKKAVFDLYRQMQHYCPAGWEKLKEWSLPMEGDGHYLHYQFRCM